MRTRTASRLAAPASANLLRKPLALAVALALAAPHAAIAAPTGATVVAGQVQVTQPNAQTMLVSQGSDKAIINWRAFSIGAGESVVFQQPGSGSVALNRVTSSAPSEIFGRLSANGKVFLVNPNGVMFGKGASVDVGGLVASTLDIADDAFLGGRYAFADGGGAGAVRNEGNIAAAERGTIALLGAQVSNNGTVSARLGTVALAAGGKVSLDFNGDGLTRIVVDAARINALVENGGAVIADGGQVTMTARALGALADTVVRQGGIVQANTLVERDGRIMLDGGNTGQVVVAGRVDASGLGAGERGGEVAVLGRDIVLSSQAGIDARGDAGGGTVLVGGDYHGANPLVPHAASTTMAAGATIRADALGSGDGGKVILWSDGATSAHGSLSASAGVQGGAGGTVETSGRKVDLAGIRVDTGSPRGRAGTWLIDPGDIEIDTQLADSISLALSTGSNVTVATSDADASGPGDILVNASITKSAGVDTTLLLEAENGIIVNSGVSIASFGSAGRLHVDFSADWDGQGGGAVRLMPGASILTNGGRFRIFGQNDAAEGQARGNADLADGVWLSGATIDTRRGQADGGSSGLISIRGAGAVFEESSAAGVGVRIDDSSLRTTTGGITISGTGGTVFDFDLDVERDTQGVAISLQDGAAITSGAGAIRITGTAGSDGSNQVAATGLEVVVGPSSTLSTTGGPMVLTGEGRHPGGWGVDLAISQGTVSAGGALGITGTGGARIALDSAGRLEARGDTTLSGAGGRAGTRAWCCWRMERMSMWRH
jgi:filamentous hemagglutinin family protein